MQQPADLAPLGLDRLNAAYGVNRTFGNPRTEGKFVAALDDEDIRFVELHFAKNQTSEEATIQFLRRWR